MWWQAVDFKPLFSPLEADIVFLKRQALTFLLRAWLNLINLY